VAEKIIVGFSGGIDSLVAASRLRDEGFDVRLVALQLHAGRPAADFRRRVAAAAAVLDLPLTIVDRAAVFQRQVVAYLRDSYRRGETPNPCIRCNARIKFPGLWQAMTDQDAAALATGHYVRRFPGPGGCWLLGPGADREKDQSYFLQMVDPAMLAAARFPLAELAKAEVAARAAALGFALRGYRESQELCFVSGRSSTGPARFSGGITECIAIPLASGGDWELPTLNRCTCWQSSRQATGSWSASGGISTGASSRSGN